jgi:hypothetical protein
MHTNGTPRQASQQQTKLYRNNQFITQGERAFVEQQKQLPKDKAKKERTPMV